MDILLLGNGFDLYHDFPTAYIDFLHTVQFLVDNYSSDMSTVGDVFENKTLQTKNNNIKKSYEQFNETYNLTKLDAENVNSLIKTAKDNLWFRYLYNLLNSDINWVDFEKEIAVVLDAFKLFFNSFGLICKDEKDAQAMHIVKQFLFFSHDTKEYYAIGSFLGISAIKNEYKLEVPFGSRIFKINESKIINELYLQLRELADILKIYLQLFVDNHSKILKTHGLYQKITPWLFSGDYVISFNYTNTYTLLHDTPGRIFNIHGNVDDNIVLGINSDIDDDLGSIDTLFLKFKKYYQRTFFKTDIKYLNEIKKVNCNPSVRQHSTLHVAGHSLDKTDEEVIKTVFEIVEKIKIFYHNYDAVSDYIKNLVTIYGKDEFDRLRSEKGLEFLPYPKKYYKPCDF